MKGARRSVADCSEFKVAKQWLEVVLGRIEVVLGRIDTMFCTGSVGG
jgi:hypothetical protein